MPEPGVLLYRAEDLITFTRGVLESFGVPDQDAATAADVLDYSDSHAIDSHGVARLITYVDMLDLERINPRPSISIVRESASTATVDGDNGLGLVVGPHANQIAMDKAADAGSGWVTVCNTNHYGAAGWYIVQAVKRGLIGWSMTNTTKLVAPLWGAERMLGTNPIAIGFPADPDPIIIDLATCAAAYGKIEIAHRVGDQIPDGWAIDDAGVETNDPEKMINGGALLPLGSRREHGGHKGYCLAIGVDLLCGVLSGANWGPFCPPFALRQHIPERSVGKGIGHFFGAMDIAAFIDPDEFQRQTADYIETMRNTRPAPGTDGPLIPGDPEREAFVSRRRDGVPLVTRVVEDLKDVSRRRGILMPEEIGIEP